MAPVVRDVGDRSWSVEVPSSSGWAEGKKEKEKEKEEKKTPNKTKPR